MHSPLNRARDERGAVAIIVALSLTLILVIAALILDFGLVRVDRQIDKSAADSAALAGLHALNAGDSNPRPFAGVCSAINYLQQNNRRFSAMTPAAGTWTDGANASIAGNPCSNTTYLNQVCTPGTLASWAKYSWTGTMEGKPLNVVIQSGYLLSGSTGFSEDSLPAASTDNDDDAQGCDQLAVIVNQQRAPGLGSLATSSDLKTSVRSVGRVKQTTGGYAPAMLLLERHTCPVLDSGSSAGSSFIHVLGATGSDGKAQPGTIHSDSAADSSCSGGSNQNIYLGRGDDGIVAYAAPLGAGADPSKPGELSSVALANGQPMNRTHDSLSWAYAAAGRNAASPGTHLLPIGRPLVTRSPVDQRYFAGVKGALSSASSVFAAGSAGYTTFPASVNQCKPTQAEVDALNLTVASRLYVNCTTNAGFGPNGDLTIPAGTIFFNGAVGPSAKLILSNAHHVYVAGLAGRDAINLGGNGATFQMNTTGNLTSNRCTPGQKSGAGAKSVLLVRQGGVMWGNAQLLQLCRTTMFLMGGQNDGCVPASAGTAPTATPCAGPTAGSGLLKQQGGDIDWTAPDRYDLMTLPNGDVDPAKSPSWSDVDGPEDLALWAESAGQYTMRGSGTSNVRGVYMLPNAFPVSIGGGASMNLVNAQFIARTISLNGSGTFITMSIDPNSGVTLPKLNLVGLVR